MVTVQFEFKGAERDSRSKTPYIAGSWLFTQPLFSIEQSRGEETSFYPGTSDSVAGLGTKLMYAMHAC